MRERAGTLSQAQQQVAAAVLDDPQFALRANVDALARRAKVSPPSIIRFCRALGFVGLREFKLNLAHTLAIGASTLHRALAPGDNMQAVTHKVLQGAASALANLEQHIVPADVERAVVADRQGAARRLLCRRQHLDVHGERRPGTIFPAGPALEFLLRRAPAIDLGGDDEPARRRARDFARGADAVPAGVGRRRQGAGR